MLKHLKIIGWYIVDLVALIDYKNQVHNRNIQDNLLHFTDIFWSLML